MSAERIQRLQEDSEDIQVQLSEIEEALGYEGQRIQDDPSIARELEAMEQQIAREKLKGVPEAVQEPLPKLPGRQEGLTEGAGREGGKQLVPA